MDRCTVEAGTLPLPGSRDVLTEVLHRGARQLLAEAVEAEVADWIDWSTTFNWVLENDWGGHVPQISFSVLFWVAVPLAAGVVRTMRRDVT